MKLSDLSKEILHSRITKEAEITGLCADSRVAGQGDLYFCYRGVHTDGHLYAAEAVKRGASAIVCERELSLNVAQLVVPDGREAFSALSAAFYSHPERKMKFVGVTGTNGKTTITYLLRSIFQEAGYRVGIIGTAGAFYGGKEVISPLTTPDPTFLFSLLADMAQEGVQIVVMESSAHALALKKELPIFYDVAIFTNLTRDHLDFFGDMTAYGNAKKTMFSPKRCAYAVINADDGFSRELEKCGAPYVTYGLDTPADAFAVIEEEGLRGSKILMNMNDELCEASLSLTGRHNVQNALAAACAARELGVSLGAISRGLEGVKSVDGRLEWVANCRGAEIFVDFAHTPDGLEKSLSALKEHCEGRLVVVFGCGGNRDEGKRQPMGECAAKLCDFAVITSDNPRFEDPCAIISQIEKGYRSVSPAYVTVEERKKGIRYAMERLRKGDILLVAGKGGENYQEIMGIKYDYNDKAVIERILEELSE